MNAETIYDGGKDWGKTGSVEGEKSRVFLQIINFKMSIRHTNGNLWVSRWYSMDEHRTNILCHK